MKYYLSNLIPRLKKFSVSLDQTAFLVDKPWVVSNNSGPFEKLIFRKDGRVHLSSDGSVQDGKWEYLPEAQSLLIDYGNEKKLYRHQYLDHAVLALKQDGAKLNDDYFLLANENTISDCDAKNYLKKKFLSANNIELKLLENGNEIELSEQQGSLYKKATINGTPPEDGSYFLKGREKKIIIKNGNVVFTINKINYPNNISVWQRNNYPAKGDLVEGFDNGYVTLKSGDRYTAYVVNGKIIKTVNSTDKTIYIFLIVFSAIFIVAIILGSIL